MSRRDARKREEEIIERAHEMHQQMNGDARRLSLLAAQFQRELAEIRDGTRPLEVSGIVSSTTGRPVVQLSWGAEVGQLEAEAARAHAMLILEAAQNAVTDAAIFEWGREVLDLDPEQAAQLIDGLRLHRADRWGQPDLDLELQKPSPEEEA